MAYPRRIDELKSQLDAAAPVGGGPPDPAQVQLLNCISSYMSLRESALNDLVEQINNAVVGTHDMAARWQSRVNQVRAELDRLFGDAVKDQKLSQALQVFWFAAVDNERTFFEKLGTVQTPQFIENLLTHQGVLARMVNDLQINWDNILSQDKSLENDQLKPVQEIDKMIHDLASEISKENQSIAAETKVKLEEKAKALAGRVRTAVAEKIGQKPTEIAEGALEIALTYLKGQLVELPNETDPEMETQKSQIQVYIDKLAYFSKTYRENCGIYKNLMSIEKGGVLTMFKNTRAQVADYLKDNDLTHTQIRRDESKRFLNEWQSGVVQAQRDDADEFNKKIFEIINKNWKVTEEMDKQFQSKFSGVFTAPLTSDTLESLTESYMFRQAIDSVNNRGSVAKIDDATKLLTASVDEATNASTQALADMSLDWPDALKQEASMANDKFRSYVHDKLKSQVDLALNSLGELRILLDPPKVVADFTREELDAMLRN